MASSTSARTRSTGSATPAPGTPSPPDESWRSVLQQELIHTDALGGLREEQSVPIAVRHVAPPRARSIVREAVARATPEPSSLAGILERLEGVGPVRLGASRLPPKPLPILVVEVSDELDGIALPPVACTSVDLLLHAALGDRDRAPSTAVDSSRFSCCRRGQRQGQGSDDQRRGHMCPSGGRSAPGCLRVRCTSVQEELPVVVPATATRAGSRAVQHSSCGPTPA